MAWGSYAYLRHQNPCTAEGCSWGLAQQLEHLAASHVKTAKNHQNNNLAMQQMFMFVRLLAIDLIKEKDVVSASEK